MHGPVPAPPVHRPPARGTVLALRVVFVAATVLSLGFLSWAAMLRAALVQRRPLGWWLFAADLGLFLGTSVLIVSFPEDDWRTNVGVALLLLQIAAVVAYYLVVDLRAERAHAAGPVLPPPYPAGAFPHPYAPPPVHHPHPPLHLQETRPPYAAPGTGPMAAPPVNPYATTAGARAHQPHQPPQPQQPSQPHPSPGHRPSSPQRIDQVRAELDELSDYLRKEGR
ncbi:hypothetical protein K2224_03275 [Streptomyces sp. BHT-5-2]|uniref:hypothetical protein n=1 Tax=unclassified Streptomyces TaxID=2593676 RepID=UPI001C8EDA05|nr:hypothetical protein [Streptomyces sp. BHT-5-2]QZL02361.1 hypothetical protein K2224_03275 [Streptomyces sp. BHT-5-2]